MVKMIAKWLNQRYLLLVEKFGDKQFGFSDAEKTLNKSVHDSTQLVSLVLSILKNAGWLNVEIDPKDSRKRLYSMVKVYRDDVFNELVEEVKSENHERH